MFLDVERIVFFHGKEIKSVLPQRKLSPGYWQAQIQEFFECQGYTTYSRTDNMMAFMLTSKEDHNISQSIRVTVAEKSTKYPIQGV